MKKKAKKEDGGEVDKAFVLKPTLVYLLKGFHQTLSLSGQSEALKMRNSEMTKFTDWEPQHNKLVKGKGKRPIKKSYEKAHELIKQLKSRFWLS